MANPWWRCGSCSILVFGNGTATAEGSAQRHVVLISPHKAREKIHLYFSVVWMGSRSTVVLCTALSLTSAFHVIRDIIEQKKSILKARF